MEESLSIMIKTKSSAIRKICTSILFNCIQNIPFSEKLMEKILLKLLNNLDFPEREGKLASASVLRKLIQKLPLEILKSKIDLIGLTMITKAVNESNYLVKEELVEGLSNFLERLNSSEDFSSSITNFENYCGKFLMENEVETQRAGILLLNCIIKGKVNFKRQKKCIEKIIEILNEVKDNVKNFYLKLEEDQELDALLKQTLWKDVSFQEGEDQCLINLKKTKMMVYDILVLFSDIVNVMALEGNRNSEDYGMIIKPILELKDHPDEDIQMKALEKVSYWYSNENTIEFVAKYLKQTLMIIFAGLKSNACFKDWFLKKIYPINSILFDEMAKNVPTLKLSYFKAINGIMASKLKNFHKNVKVFEKGLLVYQQVLENFVQDKFNSQEMQEILETIIKLQQNGNIQEDKELSLNIELVR